MAELALQLAARARSWRQNRGNRTRGRGRVAGTVWVGLAGFCTLGPALWRVDPAALNPALVLSAPSLAHPLGTDALGRDALARLMQGGATTLSVALVASLLAFGFGVAYGLCAGLAPAWADRALMRLLDAVLALPALVVLICAASLLAPGEQVLALLIGLVAWPPLARLVRNETVALRGRDFVLASQQLGAGPAHIARVHLLPAMARVLAVSATFLVGDAILSLSALSFLGLAIQPPRTSWGHLLAEGMGLIGLHAWWLIVPPGVLITLSLFAADLGGRAILGRRK
jgi:peptide/nickel transport system permease protein